MSKIDVVNEIHRNARKNFPRRSVVMRDIDDLWQADLIDMQSVSNYNSGFKYILVAIDAFSKFAWAFPLKKKSKEDVYNCFQTLLKKGRCPQNLQTDLGTEFYNNKFQGLMKTYNINHYSTYSSKKASIAERFIRTLKSKLYKEFSIKGNYKWCDDTLKIALQEYNHSFHRTIKNIPAYIDNNNKVEILKRYIEVAWKNKKHLQNRIKFQIGDYVRISKYKGVFEKGYTPNWSSEIFKIIKVQDTVPYTYLLEDARHQPILGAFYGQELLKTKHPHIYLVEKVLRRKGDKALVKWWGLSSSENSWIDKSNVL